MNAPLAVIFNSTAPCPGISFLSQFQHMEINLKRYLSVGPLTAKLGERDPGMSTPPYPRSSAETPSDYIPCVLLSAAFSLFPFTTFHLFPCLSSRSVPRDTHSYTKTMPQTGGKVLGRYQKAKRVSQGSGNSLALRRNAEQGRALLLGAFPDPQPA